MADFRSAIRENLCIYPGILDRAEALMAEIDRASFHKGIERLLRKSRNNLRKPVSPNQSNLLIMQPEKMWFVGRTMPDALYGDDMWGEN